MKKMYEMYIIKLDEIRMQYYPSIYHWEQHMKFINQQKNGKKNMNYLVSI